MRIILHKWMHFDDQQQIVPPEYINQHLKIWNSMRPEIILIIVSKCRNIRGNFCASRKPFLFQNIMVKGRNWFILLLIEASRISCADDHVVPQPQLFFKMLLHQFRRHQKQHVLLTKIVIAYILLRNPFH